MNSGERIKGSVARTSRPNKAASATGPAKSFRYKETSLHDNDESAGLTQNVSLRESAHVLRMKSLVELHPHCHKRRFICVRSRALRRFSNQLSMSEKLRGSRFASNAPSTSNRPGENVFPPASANDSTSSFLFIRQNVSAPAAASIDFPYPTNKRRALAAAGMVSRPKSMPAAFATEPARSNAVISARLQKAWKTRATAPEANNPISIGLPFRRSHTEREGMRTNDSPRFPLRFRWPQLCDRRKKAVDGLFRYIKEQPIDPRPKHAV